MKRFFLTLFLCFYLFLNNGFSQISSYEIGFQAGITNYFGDISPYAINKRNDFRKVARFYDYNKQYNTHATYQFWINRRFSKQFGLSFQFSNGQFASSDRYLNPNGTLNFEAPNFERALNFNTLYSDFTLQTKWYAHSNYKLKQLITPYFGLGVGLTFFDTYADLFNDLGQFYDYSQRDISQNRIYETSLRPLLTEGIAYPKHAWFLQGLLGLDIRLSKRFGAIISSSFNRSFSDYLDDVSANFADNFNNTTAEFAANPSNIASISNNQLRGGQNGKNDWYIIHSIGLKYNFGFKNKQMRFNPIMTNNGFYDLNNTIINNIDSPKPLVLTFPLSTDSINQIFDTIQHIDHLINSALFNIENAKIDTSFVINENEYQSYIDSLFRVSNWYKSILANDTIRQKVDLTFDNLTVKQDFRQYETFNTITDTAATTLEGWTENKGKTTANLIEKPTQQMQKKTMALQQVPLIDETKTNPNEKLINEMVALQKQIVTLLDKQQEQKTITVNAPETKSRTPNLTPTIAPIIAPSPSFDNQKMLTLEARIIALENQLNVKEDMASKIDSSLFADSTKTTLPNIDNRATFPSKIQFKEDKKSIEKNDASLQIEVLENRKVVEQLRNELVQLKLQISAWESKSNEKQPQLEIKPISQTKYVYFDLGKSTINQISANTIKHFFESWQLNPQNTIVLKGFADNTGNLTSNVLLSKKRCDAVQKELLRLGVPQNKITLIVGGQIIRSSTQKANDQDRMVELNFE